MLMEIHKQRRMADELNKSPELATQLQHRKIEFIRATGATTVAAANPGCVMQIASGARKVGLKIRVVHPVELLAEAYGDKR